MIVLFRVLAILALAYAGWVVFRVVDDWVGIVAAVVAVLLLPISVPIMAVLMLFVSSPVAGPLALWPAIAAIGILDGLARKQNGSLLIR